MSGLRIQHNISAMNAHNNLNNSQNRLGKALEKLSTGYRINRAADDAAGLAISQSMRAQIAGFNQAYRNSEQGNSMVQTAEGAIDEVHTILTRMKELAVQSSSDTVSDDDRAHLNEEYGKLKSELDRIDTNTTFNSNNLFGNATALEVQTGINTGETISLDFSDQVDSTTLSIGTIDTRTNADTELAAIDTAIDTVSGTRAKLGALQNQIEHGMVNLKAVIENMTSAESVIRDADMADAMGEFTKQSILVQAGTAMLAQANQSTQSVLQLLG